MPFKNTGALLLRLDGRIAFGSTYFCDLVGVAHDKIAETSYFDFVFPEDMDAARKLFDTNSLPRANAVRFRLRRLDGTEIWTDIQASPMRLPQGEIYAITATVTAAKDGPSMRPGRERRGSTPT
jgi:PAS domain S-box-containing protein